jgi:hypothetical protein
MGVETLISPKMIIAATPDAALPRRIRTVEIIICRFSWLVCEPDRFMLVSTEPENYVNWNAAISWSPKSYWNFRYVAPGGTIYTIFPVLFS